MKMIWTSFWVGFIFVTSLIVSLLWVVAGKLVDLLLAIAGANK